MWGSNGDGASLWRVLERAPHPMSNVEFPTIKEGCDCIVLRGKKPFGETIRIFVLPEAVFGLNQCPELEDII